MQINTSIIYAKWQAAAAAAQSGPARAGPGEGPVPILAQRIGAGPGQRCLVFCMCLVYRCVHLHMLISIYVDMFCYVPVQRKLEATAF